MIESDERGRITARSLLEMLTAAYALHPAFGEAEVLEIGVDARPAFRDNLPRLRRRGETHLRQRPLPPRLPARAGAGAEGGRRGAGRSRVPEVMDEDPP